MGFHLASRYITGYGGKVAPPYSRFYMGGETDVRGFDILSISPFVYLPSVTTINPTNGAGGQACGPVVIPGQAVQPGCNPVNVPYYELLLPGGDLYSVVNYEYRIPIFGPVTLAYFVDAGLDKLTRPGQVALAPSRVAQLQQLFPSTPISGQAYIAPGTQKPRISTGLELQVLMPVVNAPFRLYWAYNLSYVNTTLNPPVLEQPALSPSTQSELQQLLMTNGYDERRSLFRFSVGRTF
jgi:outer membrane protein insertion porin family